MLPGKTASHRPLKSAQDHDILRQWRQKLHRPRRARKWPSRSSWYTIAAQRTGRSTTTAVVHHDGGRAPSVRRPRRRAGITSTRPNARKPSEATVGQVRVGDLAKCGCHTACSTLQSRTEDDATASANASESCCVRSETRGVDDIEGSFVEPTRGHGSAANRKPQSGLSNGVVRPSVARSL